MADGISGLQFTITNIFQFAAFISPFLLGFFLIMTSIFNQDIKGIIYLAGVLLSTVINLLLLNIIRHESSPNRAPMCDLIDINIFSMGGNFDNPNLSSSFIAFTAAYLILPMIYNDQMNFVFVAFILGLGIIDMITKIINKCTGPGGAITGTLIGFLLGSLWYAILKASGYDDLLYFNEFVSNNVVCNRPSKQSFKCSVYKGGQLLSNSIV